MSWFDIIGSISLYILIACLIYKAICEWHDSKPFITWNEWRRWKINSGKTWIKERPEDWYEWLKSLSGLKKFYFFIAIIISSIFLYSFRFIFPEFIAKIDNDDTSFYNLSLAVFAILSGFGAVFGFYTSIIKTETAEQGQITDRINKAVEGLGRSNLKDEPVVEVRLGALYALERIAQDSIRDHVQIMEILCAYIRYNSPDVGNEDTINRLREDIQAALTIIGRRQNWPEGQKRMNIEINHEYKINLVNCDLHGAILSGANLSEAAFGASDLRGAFLDDANLNDAMFYDADMSEASINSSDITGAYFSDANMKNVNTDWAYALYCDISLAQGLTQKQLNKMFLGKNIKMPKKRNHPQKETDYYKNYATFDDFMKAYDKWELETIEATEVAEERAEAEEDQARREQVQMDKLDDERDRGMK